MVRYLSKTRIYRYGNIYLEVPPQVFHPGFFFSTQLLLTHVSGMELENKRFLELGAGSGLISVFAAQQLAIVTATDINHVALEKLKENAAANYVNITILHSDHFDELGNEIFDIIAINPPYYRKKVSNEAELAWFCGENGEYFYKLFSQLGNHIHKNSEVIMICCDGCDMSMIRDAAGKNKLRLQELYSRQNLLEKNTIYKISPDAHYV